MSEREVTTQSVKRISLKSQPCHLHKVMNLHPSSKGKVSELLGAR